jgi:hypothetical protein
MQAAAVAAGDNFQISSGYNSRENPDAEIEHPASDLPLTFPDLLSIHNLS